jgi:hypothetical protein
MKIRFINPNGIKFGKEEHVENTIGKTLITLGEAEVVPYKDFRERLRSETPQAFEPVAATVQWAVSLGITNGRYFISGKCSRPNCGTLQFDGKPDASLASITFIHSCGCSKPEKVPTAVVEQYKKLHRPVGKYTVDEALALHLAAPQPSKPVDLSTCTGPRNGASLVESKDNLADFLPTPDLMMQLPENHPARVVHEGKMWRK